MRSSFSSSFSSFSSLSASGSTLGLIEKIKTSSSSLSLSSLKGKNLKSIFGSSKARLSRAKKSARRSLVIVGDGEAWGPDAKRLSAPYYTFPSVMA